MEIKAIDWRYPPGNFKLSKSKLNELYDLMDLSRKEIKKIKRNSKNIKRCLDEGDVTPAKVISLNPLLIGVFSDEFDAVIVLKFPDELINKYNLRINQRMVSCNLYWPKQVFDIASDIIPGDHCTYQYRDIIPIIPLFVSDDEDCFYAMTNIYPNEIWKQFDELLAEYESKKPNVFRDGFKTIFNF